MTAVPSLARLLDTPRAADQRVAFRDDQSLRWSDLRASVATTIAALQSQPGGRWVLHDTDTFRFAIGLFALLHSGRTPLLPGNALPGTLRELAPQVQGFLGDLRGVDAVSIQELHTEQPVMLAPIDNNATVELMTSGSTGDAKRITKQLSQLDAELACQLQAWGDRIDTQTRFLASVSHQHIYGLLFRLLLPLVRGAPFAANTHDYNEPLYAAVAASARAVVISSPAHLTRLPPALDGDAVRPHLAALFSSGGPLPAAAAQQVETLFGQAPIEIFGSTETGGIASRQQSVDSHRQGNVSPQQGIDNRWLPLPGVSVTADADGLLEVRSAWADDGIQHTADRVELQSDGRFLLLGRADTIVKIEEKRLSLDEMNRRLQQHPLVAQARVLLLPGQQRLGAVIALSDDGHTALAQTGRTTLIAALRNHLGNAFERTLLPRKWRLLEALPQDSQGKVTLRALQALFMPAISTERLPGNLLTRDDNHCEIAFEPQQLTAAFAGHFPGLPVLPGVYQLDWAIRHAQRWLLSASLKFVAVDQLKFSEAIPPGVPLTLSLQRNGDRVEFSYRCGMLPLSSGRLQFAAPESTA